MANTATLSLPVKDDPRDLSRMSYPDNQFRHKVVIYGTLPTFFGFSIAARYSGIGGTHNGLLPATNDLAYIFDRWGTAVPQRVRTGLDAIFSNPQASASIRDFISKYSGQIAERNGGLNGFYGTIALRVSKGVRLYKTHNLELSGDIFNFANLLRRSWGVNKSLGNQALYAIGIPAVGTDPTLPAFDATAKRYNYRVNTAGVVNPSGDPFQIQVGLRYSF